MKSRTGLILAALLGLFVVLAAVACSDSSIHKANRAAKQVADDLHEFESQVEQQYAAAQIDQEEAKSLAQLASDATLADDIFVAKVKGLKTIDASNAAEINVWFSDLVTQIAKLNDQGVLHIKSPKAQARFQVIYQSIQTGLTTLQVLLQGLQSQTPPVKQGKLPMRPIQLAGLDAASVALLLGAFNSIAKLIVQARADGSLTDDQLQQATFDEDADTRNHAAAFIAQLEAPKS